MKKTFVLLAFLLFTLFVQGFEAVHAQTFSISGTISLPNGTLAPAGGSRFTISTDPLESFEVGGGMLESSITVTIAQNTQATSYSLTLKDDPIGSPQGASPKRLRFSCDSGCDSLGISSQGYWSESNGVVGAFDATVYFATQNFLVDIVLSGADTFSGVVKFPEGLLASGEEEIQVLLRASSFSNPAIFSQVITPDPGQSEWPFFITAPQLVGVGGWSLELSCRTCNERIVTSLHYPTQRSGDPMTLESNRGFFFVKFVSSTNMLMTFIEIPEQPTTTNVPAAIPLLLLGD